MAISTKFRKRIYKVLIITICWTLFASFSFINEYFFVTDLIALKKLSGTYDFLPDFMGNVILGIFGGITGGYILVFKMNSRYRQKSFAYGIINSGILFIVSYLGLAVIGLFLMGFIYFLFQAEFFTALTEAWNNVHTNLETPSFLITMSVWAFIVSFTQFMLQVNDKFGPGILWKFIIGKYYHPRQEERIFMFLDLNSSTSVAEKIGSKRFFELLKEFYYDITEPITSNQGEIYQYVGDEVVVTWSIDKGISGNNCLLCFFRIGEVIEAKSKYYLEKYDILPSFKAGMHLGEATVGEIGVIKKTSFSRETY